MIRQTPRPTRTATLFPYSTLFRSDLGQPRTLSCMRGAFPAGHVSASTLSGELTVSQRVPSHGLEKQGFATGAAIHWNLTAAPPIELAVKRGEGLRSEERRVGKACGSTCRSRGSRYS